LLPVGRDRVVRARRDPDELGRRLAVVPLDPLEARPGAFEPWRAPLAAAAGFAAGLAPAARAAARVADAVARLLAALAAVAARFAAGFLPAGFVAAGFLRAGFRVAGFAAAGRGGTIADAAVATEDTRLSTPAAARRNASSTRASACISLACAFCRRALALARPPSARFTCVDRFLVGVAFFFPMRSHSDSGWEKLSAPRAGS
jgi:hypothetical protein